MVHSAESERIWIIALIYVFTNSMDHFPAREALTSRIVVSIVLAVCTISRAVELVALDEPLRRCCWCPGCYIAGMNAAFDAIFTNFPISVVANASKGGSLRYAVLVRRVFAEVIPYILTEIPLRSCCRCGCSCRRGCCRSRWFWRYVHVSCPRISTRATMVEARATRFRQEELCSTVAHFISHFHT